MSDIQAKMHQIQFPLGLRPIPRLGSIQHSPDPLAVFKGPTSKGREGEPTHLLSQISTSVGYRLPVTSVGSVAQPGSDLREDTTI